MKTKSMMMSRNLVAFAGMWLLVGAFLVFGGNARAQDKAPLEITTTVTGGIELNPATDSPLYVEFEKSDSLTERMQSLLAAEGFQVVTTKKSARTVVTMSGQLVLMGGSVFYKGAQLKLGEVV